MSTDDDNSTKKEILNVAPVIFVSFFCLLLSVLILIFFVYISFSLLFSVLVFSLHDVGRAVVFLPQEMSRAGHEGLLLLLVVIPDLGGESQNSHAVPGVDLGLPHRSQPHLAVLPGGGVVNAGALSKAAVAGPGQAVRVPAVALVGGGLSLVLLVLILFVLLEARVAEILVVPRTKLSEKKRKKKSGYYLHVDC